MTSRMRVAAAAATIMLCALLRVQAADTPRLPQSPATDEAVAHCRALVGEFPAIPDAPTRVTATTLVAARADLPAYCRVQAIIRPDVGIELRLPASSWNGKFFEYARGGYCRAISMEGCDAPLRKGYACVISDQGHKSATEQDDFWAHDNLQAKVDCGFRAAHVTALAGKAIAARYYRTAPRHSYFMGCSSGGRMALVEATRFPWDFDGIIAGAAPISKSANGLALMWNVVATLDKDGKPILSPSDVRLLSRAVLARCDADDGLADGIIGDPHACKFDAAELQCQGPKTLQCLTAAQVDAVRKIYRGPVNSQGVRLYNGAPLPGSELGWIGAFVAAEAGSRSPVQDSMTNMFRYMNVPERGPSWQVTQFNWDEDYQRLGMMESYNSGANPDLRPFKAAGGKLIVYHGLADEVVYSDNIVDYYEAVERVMGGEAATRDFARLFLVPGLNHCSGGAGATVIDYIRHLEAWVEQGKAPDVIVGAHPRPGWSSSANPQRASPGQPADTGSVAFTRPVFAYPWRARYGGSGDPNDAGSFIAIRPPVR